MQDFFPQDFGAAGDGRTKDTIALQAAIDAAASAAAAAAASAHAGEPTAPAARVVLSGGTFLSGALRLRSAVVLHVAEGAKLLASPDIADFPDWPDARHVTTANCPRSRSAAFLFADECHDIAISGGGTIDCNGGAYVRRKTAPDWIGWEFERVLPMEKSLPRVVFLAGCRNVRLEDVALVNGPAGWAYWIHDCDNVICRHLRIQCDVRYPNNDGIHVNCSRDVEIDGCDIECGDDAIIVRANSRSLREDKPCERVHAHDCRLRAWAGGIRIGWHCDGAIRDCDFRRIDMRDCSYGIEMVMPKKPGNPDFGREASTIERLVFEDISMDAVRSYPLEAFIDPSQETRVAAVRDVVFRRVRSTSRLLPRAWGREGTPMRDFVFEDCDFRLLPPEAVADWQRHGTSSRTPDPREGFRWVSGFKFERTRFG